MSIHILTKETKVAQQFEQLLVGGNESFHFYEELESLITLVPKLKKTDKVFYDLQLEPSLMAFDALVYGGKKTNLIAFEMRKEGGEAHQSNCPDSAKHYYVMSSDMRKSGVRLKQLIHEIDMQATKVKRAKRLAKSTKAAATSKRKSGAVTRELPLTLSRFLTAKSDAMQDLLVQIVECSKNPNFILLNGEDGADFELVAREINYRTNGDQSPLQIVDPMRFDLNQLIQNASVQDRTSYVYLGLSYELGAMSIVRLKEFLETYSAKRANLGLCLIFGHVNDTESYLEAAVIDLMKTFKEVGYCLEIPSMEDRVDDVNLIAQSVFTTLRIAHPFLTARLLTRDAIHYLEENCSNLNYSAIVRVIRNAMALTQKDAITSEEMKSFGDDNPTAQHLLESLADEKFFMEESGVA